MVKKHVLMVADHVPYVNYVTSLGVDVTLFQSLDRAHLTNASLYAGLYLFPLVDVEKGVSLAHAINKLRPIDAVISFTEEGVKLAAIIAESLHILHNSVKAVHLVHSKPDLRELLNSNNISEVKFLKTSELDEARRFVSKTTFPVVVKPINSAGSKGVSIVTNYNELEEAFCLVQKVDNNDFVLIEEFLDGPEVSVEFMTLGGVHYPITITDKILTAPHTM